MPTTAAPRALRPGRPVSLITYRVPWEMRLELEKKWANGPWDEWDGALLQQWLEDVKEQIRAAEMELSIRFDEH